jgi:hypothetical protein
MDTLQNKLNDITQIIKTITSKNVDNIDDCKQLKCLLHVTERVINILDNELTNLAQLKLKTMSKLSNKIEEIKPILEHAEQQFMIKYAPQPQSQNAKLIKQPTINTIDVDIGNGIIIPSHLYTKKEGIPIMNYGSIMQNGRPLVIFRYSQNNYVSCTASQISDFNNISDNFRTICCVNNQNCEYGQNCKYFHDPLIWPETNHIQKFMKTNMIKKCAYFGHAPFFNDHKKILNFEQAKTLARYCAYMMLLLGQLT